MDVRVTDLRPGRRHRSHRRLSERVHGTTFGNGHGGRSERDHVAAAQRRDTTGSGATAAHAATASADAAAHADTDTTADTRTHAGAVRLPARIEFGFRSCRGRSWVRSCAYYVGVFVDSEQQCRLGVRRDTVGFGRD